MYLQCGFLSILIESFYNIFLGLFICSQIVLLELLENIKICRSIKWSVRGINSSLQVHHMALLLSMYMTMLSFVISSEKINSRILLIKMRVLFEVLLNSAVRDLSNYFPPNVCKPRKQLVFQHFSDNFIKKSDQWRHI